MSIIIGTRTRPEEGREVRVLGVANSSKRTVVRYRGGILVLHCAGYSDVSFGRRTGYPATFEVYEQLPDGEGDLMTPFQFEAIADFPVRWKGAGE